MVVFLGGKYRRPGDLERSVIGGARPKTTIFYMSGANETGTACFAPV
jgi:hypothetical protein